MQRVIYNNISKFSIIFFTINQLNGLHTAAARRKHSDSNYGENRKTMKHEDYLNFNNKISLITLSQKLVYFDLRIARSQPQKWPQVARL